MMAHEIKREFLRLPPDALRDDVTYRVDMERELPFTYESLKRSIRQYGQLRPIVVRETEDPGVYAIVDGRYSKDMLCRYADELGLEYIDVYNIGRVPDHVAWAIMVALNEIGGRADSGELIRLVQEVTARVGHEESKRLIPLVGLDAALAESRAEIAVQTLRDKERRIADAIVDALGDDDFMDTDMPLVSYERRRTVTPSSSTTLETAVVGRHDMYREAAAWRDELVRRLPVGAIEIGDALYVWLKYFRIKGLLDAVDERDLYAVYRSIVPAEEEAEMS